MTTAKNTITADKAAAGRRLDQFLVSHLPDVSRARVQELIAQEKVNVDGKPAKASHKLRAGETVEILGPAERPPLRAIPEEIPLDVVYEDGDLAVINKPAGMMVHAGAGATDDERNRGTLVNALLHRFGSLSEVGGDIRPGIVHRLDRYTSGLIVVAKHDVAHRKLALQWALRKVSKTYLALVHGWPSYDTRLIDSRISRDMERRTRMTTRRADGREARSRYKVVEKFESAYGKFALVSVDIETGRTHQVRVHLSSIGHPIVGDTLYGAPREIRGSRKDAAPLSLRRNFLHAAAIQFEQPLTGKTLSFQCPLPPDLTGFLGELKQAQPERKESGKRL